jgi:signal transduction histidine kinase
VTIKKQKALLEENHKQLKMLHASKEKVLSFLSYDLQHPFNKLIGFIRLLAKNIDDYGKGEIKGNIERLQTVAEELYASHENLLIWASNQRGNLEHTPESIDIYEIIASNISFFRPNAEKKKITFSSSVQEKTLVYADYNMINLVIRNLLSNALKFTDFGGNLTISATHTEDFVELSVSDTGVGIGEEERFHLFQIMIPSQKKDTPGREKTRLGLILCKDLVESNGGKIWCESELGKGTTFKFTLPKANVE